MGNSKNDELNNFKEKINLSEYAASVGYSIDQSESSKNTAVMRHGDDKIIIARNGGTQHYIYFSVRDETDNGTIIDFIQKRTGDNLGEVRLTLRRWLGAPDTARPPIKKYKPTIGPTTKDREGIQREFARLKIDTEHPYLLERGIAEYVQNHSRFKGKIYRDTKNNAVFPHYDEKGLVGFELKNTNFTGMPKGSSKTVWVSNVFKTDKRLVLAESAIECLSHFSLFQNLHDRYISLGGSWSPQAAALVLLMVKKFRGSEIILAFNNDDSGIQMSEKMIDHLSSEKILLNHRVLKEMPKQAGFDWNNLLTAKLEQQMKLKQNP